MTKEYTALYAIEEGRLFYDCIKPAKPRGGWLADPGRGRERTRDSFEQEVMGVLIEHYDIVLLISLLLVVTMIHAILARNPSLRRHKIPELATPLVGVFLGVIMYWTSGSDLVCQFADESFFLDVILPPVIFAEAFVIKKRLLFARAGTAISLGMFGCIVQIVIVGYALFGLCKSGIFGATDDTAELATDSPVEALLLAAVLAVPEGATLLEDYEETPALRSLLFLLVGESVVAEPIAIAFFDSLRRQTEESDDGEATYTHTKNLAFAITKDVLVIYIVSLVLGIISSIVCSGAVRLTREWHFRPSPRAIAYCPSLLDAKDVDASDMVSLEVAIMLLCPFAAYMFAEASELSGAVAMWTAALSLATFSFRLISPPAQETLTRMFLVLRFLCQKLIFAYVGMNIMVMGDDFKNEEWRADDDNSSWASLSLVISAVVLLSLTRLFIILCVGIGRYCCEGTRPLEFREMVTVWFCGHLRGPVTVVLGLGVITQRRSTVLSVALTIVAASYLILGLTGPTVITCLFPDAAPPTSHQPLLDEDVPEKSEILEPTPSLVTAPHHILLGDEKFAARSEPARPEAEEEEDDVAPRHSLHRAWASINDPFHGLLGVADHGSASVKRQQAAIDETDEKT